MGSRFAIDRLVQACQRHPKRDHIWFSTQPCTSMFSFANGEQSTVKERLVIHFRNDHATNGWITTCVDILDKGKVPILFSVEQMRNLRMNIDHTPVESSSHVLCSECHAPPYRSAHPTIRYLTLWLLQHQVGNRCTALPVKKQHVQPVQENIVHTHTRKVARKSQPQRKKSRKPPRQN